MLNDSAIKVEVKEESSNTTRLTLNNTTVRNFKNIRIDAGGTIFVGSAGASLIITGNSTIAGNQAENGGGVYILNGTINLNGGKITGNTAVEAGGGVYFYTGAIKGIPDIVFDNTANANPNIYKYQ